MKTKVFVIKREPEETDKDIIIRTLKMVPLKNLITSAEKSILINPNWVTADHSNTGNVTSTDTIEGIVIYLIKEANINPKKIIVADGGDSSSTQKTMEINDVYRLLKHGIKVMDLNSDEHVDNIEVPNPLVLKNVNVARTFLDVGCIISVPSLKTHSMAYTTLSMKNLMGALIPKGIMHSKIHKKIADLASLFRSRMKFQIIDGIIGSDGFELGGSPIPMNIIIAGEDPVAVDTVGSAIIGYSPKEVKYLKHAEQKGLGTADLNKIDVIGAQIEDVFKKF